MNLSPEQIAELVTFVERRRLVATVSTHEIEKDFSDLITAINQLTEQRDEEIEALQETIDNSLKREDDMQAKIEELEAENTALKAHNKNTIESYQHEILTLQAWITVLEDRLQIDPEHRETIAALSTDDLVERIKPR